MPKASLQSRSTGMYARYSVPVALQAHWDQQFIVRALRERGHFLQSLHHARVITPSAGGYRSSEVASAVERAWQGNTSSADQGL